MIDWKMTITIITGTSPLLVALIINIIDIREFKKEVREEFKWIRTEISGIKDKISDIKERLATLEERDRMRLH